MRFSQLKLKLAALAAFVVGIPMASQAKADDVGNLVESIFSFIGAIIDVAGDS